MASLHQSPRTHLKEEHQNHQSRPAFLKRHKRTIQLQGHIPSTVGTRKSARNGGTEGGQEGMIRPARVSTIKQSMSTKPMMVVQPPPVPAYQRQQQQYYQLQQEQYQQQQQQPLMSGMALLEQYEYLKAARKTNGRPITIKPTFNQQIGLLASVPQRGKFNINFQAVYQQQQQQQSCCYGHNYTHRNSNPATQQQQQKINGTIARTSGTPAAADTLADTAFHYSLYHQSNKRVSTGANFPSPPVRSPHQSQPPSQHRHRHYGISK